MGTYLNSVAPYEAYKDIAGTRFFVDKTDLIGEIISAAVTDGQRYFCITRPRRFGKTVMANMLGAFFGKAADAEAVFRSLKIAGCDCYSDHLNQWDVIFIDFSRLPRDCKSYETYIARIQNRIHQDLSEAYPQYAFSMEGAVWDHLQVIFEKTRTRFIFIMDEWDAIFHKDFINEEDKKRFLEFLRDLLKGQAYVQIAYMTGVLPIAKYSSGSEINMFQEYDMASKERFSEYFGFSDLQVDQLFAVYQKTVKNAKVTRDDLEKWYNGYHTAAGARLYNPRSVICALTDNQISSYWTNSGPYDEIFYYIRNNIQDVRDDLILLVAGERIEIKLQGYAATSVELSTKNQIYSAMVVYGLLTYEHGAVFIPNRELMEQFQELLLTKDSLGYVYSLAKKSEEMLKATLTGNTDRMSAILKYAHNTESPIFFYNSEIELSAVVNLVYLAARDKYRVEREDKAGKGYVDFIFYPEQKNEDALILELKIDSTPEQAVRQIKEKEYAVRLRGKLGEKANYTGRILAVGISYDRKTKEHACMVEAL